MTPSITEGRDAGAILFIARQSQPQQDADDDYSTHQKPENVSSLIGRYIQQHGGKPGVGTDGSSVAVFSQVKAVALCAMEIQKDLWEQNRKVTLNRRIHLTMGIHLVYSDKQGLNLDGEDVRIAGQLAALAPAGQILISKAAQRELVEEPSIVVEHLGVRELLNPPQSMDVYRVVLPWIKERKPEAITHSSPAILTRVIRILFALGIIALLLWYFWTSFPVSRAEHHAIAVLPFVCVESNPDNDALSELICTNLIEHVSADNRGNVLSLSRVMPYKNLKKSSQEIAGELQAGFIVEGVFKVEDEYIQLVVHLTETSGKGLLWSKEYDLPLTDLSRIEDDMAVGITKAIIESKNKSGR